jgi:N-acetylglucosaminyldiphosphoundecaprenol N-acetyl-beta-D-mannosaminyltransferase
MLIFSGCAGVPAIGLSYDPKIDSMMKRLEMPCLLSVRTLRSSGLIRCAEDIMENRDQLAETVSKRAAEMAAMCRTDVRRAAELLKE